MNLSTWHNQFGDNDVQVDFSIIEFFTETGLDEDDLLDIDPGFVGSGDYSLSLASVAIGAGTDEYENIDTLRIYNYYYSLQLSNRYFSRYSSECIKQEFYILSTNRILVIRFRSYER